MLILGFFFYVFGIHVYNIGRDNIPGVCVFST